MKMKVIAVVLVFLGFTGIFWISTSANSHTGSKTILSGFAPDTSIHWDKMDRSERMAYMKQVVFPTMKPLFAAFDPKRFSNMKCITCHGNGALDDSYKMPNPQIWKLPRTKEGWAKADTNFLAFMRKTVKPKMADLLGIPPYDQQHKDGFGCGNCHTDEQ